MNRQIGRVLNFNGVYVHEFREPRSSILGIICQVNSICAIFSDSAKNEQLTQFAHTRIYIYIP